MERKRIIILTDKDTYEAWGSLSEICKEKGLSYHTLSRKKFPFEHKGIYFIKVNYKEDNGITKNK